MREYECVKCRCWKCSHDWIETMRVDAEMNEHHPKDIQCPECGNDEYDVEVTRWKAV